MKSKTINAVLSKKLKDWIDSINDSNLKKLIEKDVIVTGGCIASMLLNEEIKDYDVYFRTKSTAKAVAQYYVEEFNSRNKNHKNKLGGSAQAFVLDGSDVEKFKSGAVKINDIAPGFSNQGKLISRMIASCYPDRIKIIVRSDGVAAEDSQENITDQPFEDVFDVIETGDDLTVEDSGDKYRPIFLSSNAITLSNKIQIVIRFYGEPEEIHENYDFVHCTNYWTFEGGVVLYKAALEALMQKELVYVGSKYPLCSIIRTRKFLKRGYQINAGQYLKMAFQLNQLDLTDVDVLEDQLVGVDSMYFMSLINGLRAKIENNKDFKVEQDYVCSIIDRIF